MGQPDKTQKKLGEYPDVAADIINGTVYHGEDVVKETDLEQIPPASFIRDADGTLRERTRDLLFVNKKDGIKYAYFGIENQYGIDNTLPLRIAELDAAFYRKQVDLYMDENKVKNNPAYEKTIHDWQKLTPIVTTVLYYGKKWDGPKTLLDMMEPEAGEVLKPFLMDYKLNIVELRNDREMYKNFRSDFRFIARFLSIGRNKKEVEALFKNYEGDIRHLPALLDVLAEVSADSKYRKIKKLFLENQDFVKKGGQAAMCWVYDMIEQDGVAQGIAQGIIQGMIEMARDLGASFENTRKKVMEKYPDDSEKVDEYMRLYWK